MEYVNVVNLNSVSHCYILQTDKPHVHFVSIAFLLADNIRFMDALMELFGKPYAYVLLETEPAITHNKL